MSLKFRFWKPTKTNSNIIQDYTVRRPLPPLRLFTVFESVLRHRGVKHAADELNVSQPAISQSLRQLEESLGVKLLDRSTRPLTVTEAGAILLRATTESIAKISEAIIEIDELRDASSAYITVACSVGFATFWLMPRLSSFYASHPDVSVNVVTTVQGAPRLLPGIDIAIRFGNGAWNDGKVRKLFDERVDAVCSPAFLSRAKDPNTLIDTAPLIHVDVEDERWLTWEYFLSATGASLRKKTDGPRFTNYIQASQAAIAGQGLMLGWRSITGDAVKEGQLVTILDKPLIPKDSFFLVLPPSTSVKAPQRQQFSDWLLSV
nr:LysR substrate-binding domain-containing protein [Agrobacterium sp. S2/73]